MKIVASICLVVSTLNTVYLTVKYLECKSSKGELRTFTEQDFKVLRVRITESQSKVSTKSTIEYGTSICVLDSNHYGNCSSCKIISCETQKVTQD